MSCLWGLVRCLLFSYRWCNALCQGPEMDQVEEQELVELHQRNLPALNAVQLKQQSPNEVALSPSFSPSVSPQLGESKDEEECLDPACRSCTKRKLLLLELGKPITVKVVRFQECEPDSSSSMRIESPAVENQTD